MRPLNESNTMSSILTNNSAMVALQTLKSINNDLSKTQEMISTGKSVGNAKDNAAVWSISKVMESDVKGFKAISDSLALGSSTVAVAQNGAETVTDLLTEIKGKIVASQEANVDREKIQTDISALRDQIGAVVGAAQFNGLNLLSSTDTEAGSGSVDILSSLDRSADGSVATSNISVAKQDLGTGAAEIESGATATAAASNTITGTIEAATAIAGAATPGTQTLVINSVPQAGTGFGIAITADGGELDTLLDTAAEDDIAYVSRDGDTTADVANGIAAAFNAYIAENGPDGTTVAATVSGSTITFTGETGAAGDTLTLQALQYDDNTETTIGGGLAALSNIDVSTDDGAAAALESIEALIQTAIDGAATFGSARGRIETQSEFVANLTDSLKSGIGTMVDANMEETSARLQALQVQQQLGVQSLSIANQAPQSILSLFR